MTELNKDLLETSEVYRNVAALDCFSDEMESYTEEDYKGTELGEDLTPEEMEELKEQIKSRNVNVVNHIDDETLPDTEF